MAFVDRARLQRRLTTAAQAAYLWATLGLILVFLLWWAGRVGSGGAFLGMALAGGIASLGYRTDEGSPTAAVALVALGLASVGYAFYHQPFTVDLLGAVAVLFFMRGLIAARMLQGLDFREAEALRKKEEKRAGRKGKRGGASGGGAD